MKKFNLRAAVPGFISMLQFSIFPLKKKVSIVMPITKIMSLFVFITGFLFLSCNPSEPGNAPTGLEFKAEDASCTEAWLTLKANNIAGAEVYRGDSLIFNFAGQNIDTTLYDEELLPDKSYSYNLIIRELNNKTFTRCAAVQTMDTTSHNFTWQTFTFGEHSSSVLYDVVIIDENNIWAVGEIYMKDSLGNPEPTFYNVAHWNGIDWELKKLFYKGGIWRITTIFAFNENDIWFTGYMRYYNGKFLELPIPDILMGWQINKLWGSSSSDMYAVGDKGNIAHYDGSNWTKIESGTDTNINDVFGIRDDQNRTVIYCPVSSFWVAGDKKILKIIDGKTDSVRWHKENRLISCWASNQHLYVCGQGVFVNKYNKWEQINLPAIETNSIRGNNINDIFLAGDFGMLVHFNGFMWKLLNSFNDKGYAKVSIKGDIAALCGRHNGRALIEIGRRK